MAAAHRDPQATAATSPGDARLFQRAEGSAGHHQSVRRQAEAHLGRAGGRDPARHQERRAQDQRGYRQPAGDHRRHPQGVRGEARGVRSAQLHEAGARSHEEGGGPAHDPVRPGRPLRATTSRFRWRRWPRSTRRKRSRSRSCRKRSRLCYPSRDREKAMPWWGTLQLASPACGRYFPSRDREKL